MEFYCLTGKGYKAIQDDRINAINEIKHIEIFRELISDKKISDEQIKKYNLQFLISDHDKEDEDENFPGQAVADLKNLKEKLHDEFKTEPNPYMEKKQTIREPKNSVDEDKKTYMEMYDSPNNSKKCFCQMCQKTVLKKYIERNNVQDDPQYGWKQMYLNLCLKCSKDYIYLRNNHTEWNKFIKSIINEDIGDKETVQIAIGDRELTFTAVHLAEIQTILELESENPK